MNNKYISWTSINEMKLEVPANIAGIIQDYEIQHLAVPLINTVIPMNSYKLEIVSEGKSIGTFVAVVNNAAFYEIFNIAQTSFTPFEPSDRTTELSNTLIQWTISLLGEDNQDQSPLTLLQLTTKLA